MIDDSKQPAINIIVVVGIVILIALQISEMFPLLSSLSFWITMGISLLFYCLMFVLAQHPRYIRPARYTRLVAVAVWLLYGISASLILVLVGSLIGTLLRIYRTTAKQQIVYRHLPMWISINALSVLAGHLLFLLLGGVLPFSSMQLSEAFLPLIVSIIAGDVVFIAVITLMTNRRVRDQQKYLMQYGLFDVFMDMVSILLPLIHQEIGWVAFALVLAMVAAQALQQGRLHTAEKALHKRLNDLSMINHLGRAIASQTTLSSILQSLYAELTDLIDASSYFVALSDDDYTTIDYPLTIENGKPGTWSAGHVGRRLTEHVIKSRETLLVSGSNTVRLQQLSLDAAQLEGKTYLIVPLTVSEKTIGVIGVASTETVNHFDAQDVEILQTISSQASLALRNTTLYERTSRLASNLAQINRSLQDVMFNLDRDDALRSACMIALKVTDAQQVAVFLLEPNDNSLRRVQLVGTSDSSVPETVAYHPAAFERGPRIINRQSRGDNDQDELGGFHTSLQVALRSGNTIIGIMIVYHEYDYVFDAPELDLLQMLANQITAALDNADLLQALELYAAEQAQLVHLSRISSANLDLERIIQDVCTMLSQIMEMPHIEIALYQPENDVLQIYSDAAGDSIIQQRNLNASSIPEIEAALNTTSYNSITTYYIDQPALSDEFSAYLRRLHATTAVLAPLRLSQQSIGILILIDVVERIVNDNEYRLIEMAAHQIAAQIHNARIHMLTEEALVQRLEQLSLIEEIAQQISQALNPDVIIDNVLDAAMQATQASLASLSLVSLVHANEVTVIWKEYIEGDLRRQTQKRSYEGVVGHIIATGEIVLLPDNSEFKDYQPPHSPLTYLSTLAVPLTKGDTIIGVLNLESTQKNFFTNEQASFIRSLAGHAAISIDNARLLEERERQINTLTQLRSLSLEMLSVTDQQQVAAAILQTALIILDGQAGVLFARPSEESDFKIVEGGLLQDGEVQPARPPVPLELVKQAAEKGTTITVGDVNTHPAYQQAYIIYKHSALLVIPIQRRGIVHEVLCITFSDQRLFSAQDLHTIDLLAVQSASHLENAALSAVIRSSNDRMRAILDSTRDGIILLDEHGHLQDANIAAERLLRLPLQAALKQNFIDYVRAYPDADPAVRDIMVHYAYDSSSINDSEFRIGASDNLTDIKTLVTPVLDTSGKVVGLLLVIRDITEEKSMEEFRGRLQEMVLHDLRSPLSSIVSSMYLSLSVLEYPDGMPVEETLKKTIEISLDSATSLLSLVESLRELPQIAQMEFARQPADLRQVAEKAYKMLAAVLEESQITVEYDLPETVPYVDIDPKYVQRVFQNLMHNAYKFTPEGGTIRISAEPEHNHPDFVRVMVSDTGPGIPESQRERIFGQFIQIEGQVPRTGGKGTGLGLNFSKLTIEGHGGQIWVEPVGPLPGATFAFTLPVYEGDYNDAEEPPALTDF